ncbi:MAG: aminopeptidase P family protein [Candidatus Hydrogenedentes bacterium]|nr:aminopeptidase P family protein [Candidatus Hydrogenedentota bacterium]
MSQPSIPEQEYRDRMARAQRLVREKDLDVVLVNSNEAEFANVRYFSNYWPIFEMSGVVIPPEGEPTLLIGPESATFAHDRSKISRVRLMTEYREPADPAYPGVPVSTFAEVFAEAGVAAPRRIGIAGYLVTTAPVLDGLRAAFPKAEIRRADDIMVSLRSVKSEAEIACLKEAFRIAEDAIGDLLHAIRPGMTELQVVGLAQKSIYERGAEYEGMPQYVFSGISTTHAISRPTHRVLEKGDLVQLNISARVDGYSSGVGRPLCLGKMNDKARRMIEFGMLAHQKTRAWMKAGVVAAEVAKKYKNLFVSNGYKRNFLYGPAHGLGMIEVEPPWMEETSDYRLEENMTFNIDTFFYEEGEFGFRWENGVRITKDGVEGFSSKYMELLELDV